MVRSPDPLFSKLTPADFNERVLPDITTKLRETPFTTHPVWRFVNSSKPEIAVNSSTEVTAPTFSLKPKGQFFHQGSDVSIDLPHGITEAERTDSILSAVYAKTIYDVDALRGFAYSPTQGFLPHAAFEGAKSYVQSGDSEISRALTERFGALDARSKLIAQRLVDSLKPDSRWSASQMVEQAGLEPTTANLAAATNFHVFHLPEEYQPLGIQVVGQAAEATVTRQLPKLQERFSGPVPQKLVADLVTEEARRTRHTMEFLFQKRVEGFDWKEDESDLDHSEF